MLTHLKITSSLWRHHQETDTGTSSAFTDDGDQIGITTKVLDVLVDPSQSFDLIENASIAGDFVRVQRQETEGTQTILNGHHDDILIQIFVASIKQVASSSERAAMNPEDDR